MPKRRRLLPEWYHQDAVLLAWPDANTDWHHWLDQVQTVYLELIVAINGCGCGVILLIRPSEIIRFRALSASHGGIESLLLVPADFNDTWVRDYGFLTLINSKGCQGIEFIFNGWGKKFAAARDNAINREVLAPLLNQTLHSIDWACEGGALEIDSDGHLLTTAQCLLNPQRNGQCSLSDYRELFIRELGATTVTILENGYLHGDDTDGHIDTLARFTPNRGIVCQSCYNRTTDEHYLPLRYMAEELRQAFPDHTVFELPLPDVRDNGGERLPASYANFLINNGQILLPVYDEPEDGEAIAVMMRAYPHSRIVPVNCRVLPVQYGSLHCITMQIPVGTLKPQVVRLFDRGIVELQTAFDV